MADIFSEVDEEVRRDRAEALWARYGNYVVGGVLMVVLGVASYWGWQQYQTHRQTQAAEAYVAAIRADGDKSVQMLSAIASQGGAFSALARLRLAADAIEQGDNDKAKGIFMVVSADSSIDPAFRGLSALRGALLELEAGNAAGAKSLVANLDKEGGPFRLSAMEITALAELQAGDKAKAREIFSKLRELAAAQKGMAVMEARAEQMLDRLAE